MAQPDWDQLLLASEDLVLRVRSLRAPGSAAGPISSCPQWPLIVHQSYCAASSCEQEGAPALAGAALLLAAQLPRPALPCPAAQSHTQESQGFPRVERDVLQVEQFSQKLRGKASRLDATSEALDASRLLAQEGLNPRRCGQRPQ